jgi:LmbE family N-acetylglucosaminyl deacetylase
MFNQHGIEVVLTHAYEGGHPDHDAVAFAVHTAARLAKRTPLLLEAPLYHLEGTRLVWQRFVPGTGRRGCVLKLSKEQQALKRRLYDAHKSQADCLANASVASERLRVAPEYDFSRLPQSARLSSLFRDAKLTQKKWESLTKEALLTLGLKV